MKGLEAIELMKQGKMIKGGIWIYSMDSNGIIWLKTELQTGWVGAHMFNILANDYEEYIEPKTLTGWERVDECETYHLVSCKGVHASSDYKAPYDDSYYNQANYFSTKEKAEEINFKQTLFRKLQRFSDENGGSEIDWSDNIDRKFFIFYCSVNKELDFYWHYTDKYFGQIYFVSEEIAKKAIELFHDDLIKYFTGDFGGEA